MLGQARSKLSERREQARSAKRERSKSAKSGRSKSSGKGSAKATRKVNAGGSAILSKSSKDLEARLNQAEAADLTRALRPSFGNALRKGEGVGGGARPTMEKERAIGEERKASPQNQVANVRKSIERSPVHNVSSFTQPLDDTYKKVEQM